MAHKLKPGGRKRGGHNRGYWFRQGRGWFITEGSESVPLRDEDGNHIKDREAKQDAERAHARYLLENKTTQPATSYTVQDVCQAYLDHCHQNGSKSTFDLRARLLFDLCTGLPGRYRGKSTRPSSKRIHPGLGGKPAHELIALDIKNWLDAHKGWKGTKTMAVQAVRRAFSYAVEMGLLKESPIKGIKAGNSGKRVTYLTPEEEQAILGAASKHFADAFRVCILTGARPGSELAALEARHVEETARGQLWRFPPEEHKTGHKTKEDRVILVPEEAATIVRQRIRWQGRRGKVFQNSRADGWTQQSMSAQLSRIKKKLRERGVQIHKEACWYTCRHTFAKRKLGGFSGEPKTIEQVAGLMGNSRDVCWEHYGKWCERNLDLLWDAVD